MNRITSTTESKSSTRRGIMIDKISNSRGTMTEGTTDRVQLLTAAHGPAATSERRAIWTPQVYAALEFCSSAQPLNRHLSNSGTLWIDEHASDGSDPFVI